MPYEWDFHPSEPRGCPTPGACSAAEQIAALQRELELSKDELEARNLDYDSLANELVFHGNSVYHWHSKANAYKQALGQSWAALREAGLPADGNTDVAAMIRKLSADLAAAKAELTTAYMTGYHKRDDEVAALKKRG